MDGGSSLGPWKPLRLPLAGGQKSHALGTWAPLVPLLRAQMIQPLEVSLLACSLVPTMPPQTTYRLNTRVRPTLLTKSWTFVQNFPAMSRRDLNLHLAAR